MPLAVPRRLDDPPERDLTRAPPGTIDTHVHIFPPRVFAAIRRWFDENAWDIRFPYDAEQVDAFMAARGVERYLGLHYPHVAGMGEALNAFALEFSRTHPRCIPCASVLPGEPRAAAILDAALGAGARAVKIHCHVQCIAPDDARMIEVCERVVAHDAVLLIHCGNEPKLPGYACDVASVATAAGFDRMMRRFPEMKVIVPHFGAGEVDAYAALLARYPRMCLDTAMALAGYFPFEQTTDVLHAHADRILYGTDFPHIPYAWDRDLRALESANLPPATLHTILTAGGTLFGS